MKSILLAFAMFSRIPVPEMEWKEENMRCLMAAFPLVGVVIGAVVMGWEWVCAYFGFGPLLQGTGFALLPVLVSGGIHLDGFCDTVDALSSRGDAEKKQRILRDPHTGSFAVVAVCAYFMLFVSLVVEGIGSVCFMRCFALTFVLSRCVSGLATLLFYGAQSSSLAKCFQNAAARKTSLVLLWIETACLGAALLWLGGASGVAAFVVPWALFGWCGRMAVKQFGGMSGDLSGWLVQMCEMGSLAGLVVVSKVQGVL